MTSVADRPAPVLSELLDFACARSTLPLSRFVRGEDVDDGKLSDGINDLIDVLSVAGHTDRRLVVRFILIALRELGI